MPQFDVVLFDFDGTIADTSPGIKEGLLHAFSVNNLPLMTDKEMDKFIGPPLDDSFEKYCRVTREKATAMVLDFREHYHVKGIDKFIIYPGVEAAIKILKEKGLLVALATSKPEPMAVHILKKSGLYDYFDIIQGATLDGSLIKKNDIVHHVLNSDKANGKRALMVGDTEFDIIGAHKNNIPCLWVNYGFGTWENAERENPEYRVESTKEMIEFFKSL